MPRGGSRAAAASKMECFVIIVNRLQPLSIITKHSILDVAAALDPPLIPDCKIFSVEFVRMWSIREEVLHVKRVGQLINCFKENIWQNWYLFMKVGTGPWQAGISKIQFPFCKRLMLKSPRSYTSLSFKFERQKLLTINSMKLVWFGGL